MSNHSKIETARIIGQIQGCYNNVGVLLKPTINQVEFEKAIQEEKIPFFFDHVIKGYAGDALKRVEAETDEIKKGEIAAEASKEFLPLEEITVVFDNVQKSIFVDVIDITTGTYKDNAINRKFDRVGRAVVK